MRARQGAVIKYVRCYPLLLCHGRMAPIRAFCRSRVLSTFKLVDVRDKGTESAMSASALAPSRQWRKTALSAKIDGSRRGALSRETQERPQSTPDDFSLATPRHTWKVHIGLI